MTRLARPEPIAPDALHSVTGGLGVMPNRVPLPTEDTPQTNNYFIGFATDANDKITGDHLSNSMIGRDGNDTLSGIGGDDILSGGHGRDSLHGGSG
jgi:Ca2+-binding RTX toxin-like protein